MRPDKLKVVFCPTTNDKVISATTLPNHPDAWQSPHAQRLIKFLTARNIGVAVGGPAALKTTLITRFGMQEVEMTEPDADGMQWRKM